MTAGRMSPHPPGTLAGTTEPDGFPVPAAPVPPARPLGLFSAIRALLDNPISALSARAYEVPILEISRFRRSVLLVNHPATIEHILLDRAENYRKSDQQRRQLAPALEGGLLLAEGEAWKRARRITAPLFTPKAVSSYRSPMQSAAMETVERWLNRPDPQIPVDIAPEFDRLTVDVAAQTLFSRDSVPDRNELLVSAGKYMKTLGRVELASVLGLPDWLPSLRNLRARPALRSIRSVAARLVDEAHLQQAVSGENLLDRLVGTRDPVTGRLLSSQETIGNILTFLAAGYDTTSNALCWIFYLLSLYPEIALQVRDELSRVVGSDLVTRSHFERLPLVQAVIHEAMRLYPPAPFIGREALADDEIGGHAVGAGTQILISPWVVHRHRSLWSNPDKFRPERFMHGRADNIAKGAFIPFGLGPRICIGQGFAMLEIATVMAAVLPRFHFVLDPRTRVVPQANITLRPRDGIRMLITPI